ncbi:uncharacterized protein LOC62_02G002591 [Vanrija pseudolonga]|uniref:Uncharacterized protein n=1 Tax=Vanrija pseudolonga TaxID=143232 RepID=A0AAF0Y6B5_9TREE|nr:hypothetical protein LOC62_02G002591 [Vanrija pseudolonga]
MTTTPPHPLGFLSRLSRSVYLYKPDAVAAKASSKHPRLILLATWMGAQDVHIAKYLTPYRIAYPASPIVVIRTELSDFMVPGRRTERNRQFARIIPVLRDAFPELAVGGVVPAPQDETDASSISSSVSTSDIADSEISGVLVKPPPRAPRAELLIHVWSNGGGSALAALRGVLKKAQVTLPRYSLVLDSTPGQFHYRSTFTAFALSFPPWLRRILSPFLHAMVAWFWLRQNISRVFGGPGGPLRTAAASHNTPIARASEVRRAYIYSDADKLIHAADVEAHAREAEALGFTVRRENFGKSAHVAHMKADPERYWRIARETFEGPPTESELEGYAVVDAVADAEAAARALDKAAEETVSAEQAYAAAQASADAAAAAYEEAKAAEVVAAAEEEVKVDEVVEAVAVAEHTHHATLDLEAAKASDDAEAAAAAIALEKAAASTASAEEAYAKAKADADAAAAATTKPKKGKKRGGKH